jgi:hypothetical protein
MVQRSLVLVATAISAAQFSGRMSHTIGSINNDIQHGNCALMSWLDFAPKFHVALNKDDWASGNHCGRCISVKCIDPACKGSRTHVTAQITDKCSNCKHGDIVSSELMFTRVTGGKLHGQSRVEWDFVNCPVVGGLQICAMTGSSPSWLRVQASNSVNGIKKMRINGASSPLFSDSFYFISTALQNPNLSETHVSMTSWAGEEISTYVSLQAGKCTQISKQFSKGRFSSRSKTSSENVIPPDGVPKSDEDYSKPTATSQLVIINDPVVDQPTNMTTWLISSAIGILILVVLVLLFIQYRARDDTPQEDLVPSQRAGVVVHHL